MTQKSLLEKHRPALQEMCPQTVTTARLVIGGRGSVPHACEEGCGHKNGVCPHDGIQHLDGTNPSYIYQRESFQKHCWREKSKLQNDDTSSMNPFTFKKTQCCLFSVGTCNVCLSIKMEPN